jgi:hypothetical protein
MLSLYERIKKGEFKRNKEIEDTYGSMQEEIKQALDLRLPDFSKQFILNADASGTTIGGILLQKEGEEEFPIFFISRKLTKAEVNYTFTESECLEIIWCIKVFHVYLGNRCRAPGWLPL